MEEHLCGDIYKHAHQPVFTAANRCFRAGQIDCLSMLLDPRRSGCRITRRYTIEDGMETTAPVMRNQSKLVPKKKVAELRGVVEGDLVTIMSDVT